MGTGTDPLCVFSKTQKQPQYTCQAKTIAGNSFTPHADLLVHPSVTIWTVMDLQGQKNAACESRPGYLQPCHRCVWIVLECGFHVQLKNVFQLLRDYAGFWQIQSQFYCKSKC